MMRSRWALSVVFLVHCSWCAAPKPTPEEDLVDRDAAPHAEDHAPRCSVASTVALPGAFEIGRVINAGSRVLLGARQGTKAGVLEVAVPSARFTEVGELIGDVPPPLPVVSGDQVLAVEYEGDARHLVVRDVAAPRKPIAELPREPPDDSLAYDATILADGGVLVVWDAPDASGSAIFGTVVRAARPSAVVRLSPADVDADTPRIGPISPGVVVLAWLAHRSVSEGDASFAAEPIIEAPAESLDHAWVEMQTFDGALHPTSALRHVTLDTGHISSFELELSPPTSLGVVARDAVELQAGQGGTGLFSAVTIDPHANPVRLEATTSAVLAEHVGRGLPLRHEEMTLFVDPENHGHSVVGQHIAPEPALDAARPLVFIRPTSLLLAPETGTEVRVLQCVPLP